MDRLWCIWLAGAFVLLWVSGIATKQVINIENEEELLDMEGITAILLVSRKDSGTVEKVENVKKLLHKSAELASEYGVALCTADCDKTKLSLCKGRRNIDYILAISSQELYRVMITNEMKSPLQLVSSILNSTVLQEAKEIIDKQDWEEQRKHNQNDKDIVMIYLPEHLDIEEHMKAMRAITLIPDNVTPFITSNKQLMSMQNSLPVGKPLMQWFFCEQNTMLDSCPVIFSTSDLSRENLGKLFTMAVKLVILDERESSLSMTLSKWSKLRVSSLILIAGHGKNEVAVELALKFKEIITESIQCVVVFGDVVRNPTVNYRVQDDKIFVAISSKPSPEFIINMGYLDDETTDELTRIWQRFTSNDNLHTKSTDEITYDEEFPNPEEIEDDPVAHAVHSSRNIRKLYYYDYKTIPRLTDKTFTEVTESDNYAVVLVTLEFNARAIAALTIFAEIHLKYEENGRVSPLYRLECYNWPDVCQKIGVYTTPRMFFYPAKSEDFYEYKGMWDKTEMEKEIERFKMPTVFVVNKEEELGESEPPKAKTIVGLFKSHDGVTEFREAAKELRSEIAFLEMHDTAGQSIASELGIPFKHRTILALENLIASDNDMIFKTKDDIIKFASTAYEIPRMHQLTLKSYPKLMSSEKPMVIYFMPPTESKVTNDIMSLWDKLASSDERIIFTWMDTENNSVSDFVLGKYNSKAKFEMPIIAFLDKKSSVMLKSCASTDCGDKSLQSWLDDCLSGKIAVSYTMSKEPWKPRLAGYDYLEMMKQENTYPVPKSKNTSQREEETEPVARKGRRISGMGVEHHTHHAPRNHGVSKPEHTEL